MTIACNKVILGGTLPGGEVWSVNPTFHSFGASPLITDFADLQEWTAALASGVSDVIHSELSGLMSPSVALTSFTAQYIGPDGKLFQQAKTTLTTPFAGTGSATKPFQTSVVLSLLTGRPGRSFRGRLYWPAIGAGISATTLRQSAATTAGQANAARSMLQTIASLQPSEFSVEPAVVSQTASMATQITAVQVGDVLDVQRRRRDAAIELYSSSPLT